MGKDGRGRKGGEGREGKEGRGRKGITLGNSSKSKFNIKLIREPNKLSRGPSLLLNKLSRGLSIKFIR
jgi:hypothetical protein